jgi:hypothetical protein
VDEDDGISIQLGSFRLSRHLGTGGMGEVWRAEHTASALPVAVKLITADDALDPGSRAAFSNEVRAMARLSHPRIAQVYDFDRVGEAAARASEGRLVAGCPYLVMELLDAGALDPFRYTRPWTDLKRVLLALLDALAHAHARGLVHRDLKPGNILFAGPESPRPGLRLTDFGIAHALGSGEEEEVSWGTPHYMSPEQHFGESRDFGPWTDLYALGCIAYELTCGTRPFPADTVYTAVWGHLNHEVPSLEPRMAVPAGFGDWIRKLLEKRPQDRFSRAADAAFVLESLEEERVWGLPPLPFDWKPLLEVEQHPLGYVGAGLGLFSLRSLPLLGREAELAEIWKGLVEVWTHAQPRVLVLHGPAGYGKSRLVEWLCERAGELGGSTSLHVSHDLSPGLHTGLRAAVTGALGCGGLAGLELRARLRALFAEQGVEEVVYESERMALYLESGENRPEDLELLSSFLHSRSLQRPLILWLDEPHRSEQTLDLIEHVLGEGAGQVGPVLVVATVRDESLARCPEALQRLRIVLENPANHAVAIPVPALDEKHCRRLAREVLGLEEQLSEVVLQHASGSPMFVIQLVRDWVQQGLLESDAAGFIMRSGVVPRIPESVQEVWLDRVRLVASEHGDDAVLSLQVAAALGTSVDLLEWNHVCSMRGLVARPALLDALFKCGLARATAMGWEFAHEHLRDSLEQSSRAEGRWVELHTACLDMLGQRYSEGTPGLEARLQRHRDEVSGASEGERSGA